MLDPDPLQTLNSDFRRQHTISMPSVVNLVSVTLIGRELPISNPGIDHSATAA